MLNDKNMEKELPWCMVCIWNCVELDLAETNRLPVAVVEADESKSASVSFATVIAIVAMVTVVALLVMDLACFSINKCGLTWTICGAVRGTNPKTEQLTTDVEEGERLVDEVV